MPIITFSTVANFGDHPLCLALHCGLEILEDVHNLVTTLIHFMYVAPAFRSPSFSLDLREDVSGNMFK